MVRQITKGTSKIPCEYEGCEGVVGLQITRGMDALKPITEIPMITNLQEGVWEFYCPVCKRGNHVIFKSDLEKVAP